MRYTSLGMVSLSVLAQVLLSTTVHAQATSDAASPAGSGASVGEIVVTARKRSESLLDVPSSITAISGAGLARAGVNSVVDLQNQVPDLQYSPRGDLENQITIRGVGGDSRNIGIESGVGEYVDGIYQGRSGGYNQDLDNIQQIEVLRGPQGTVFGKNTTGGVINIITRKPTDSFQADGSISYGNYNAVIVKGDISGALADNLYAGVSASSTTRDGWINNLYDNSHLDNIDRQGARMQLRYTPTSALEFNWAIDGTQNRSDFALTVPAYPNLAGPLQQYALPNPRFDVSMNSSNASKMQTGGIAQTINYKFVNGTTLSSVTSYRVVDNIVNSDGDGLSVNVLHSGPFTDDSDLFTQELRLVSPSSQRLRYVAGLYYFWQDATSFRDIYAGGSAANNFTPSLATGFITNAKVSTNAYAGYASFDYDILPVLTATAGVRYTSETKDGSYNQVGIFNYSFPTLHRVDSDVSWNGSLDYHFSKDIAAYFTVTKGFKSGGFNVDPITAHNITASDLSFAPESVINYELGTKGSAFNNALRFDADIFYSNYYDKQVAQFVTLPGISVPTTIINNAGQARMEGFEVNTTIAPDSYWLINLSASRLIATYTSFPNAATNPAGGFYNYTGDTLEDAPEWSADASVQKRQPIPGGDLILWVNARYTGRTYFSPDDSITNQQDGYMLYDARLSYEIKGGRYTIALWGKNLSDTSYWTFSRISSGIHQVLYGDPRTFGVQFSAKF